MALKEASYVRGNDKLGVVAFTVNLRTLGAEEGGVAHPGLHSKTLSQKINQRIIKETWKLAASISSKSDPGPFFLPVSEKDKCLMISELRDA